MNIQWFLVLFSLAAAMCASLAAWKLYAFSITYGKLDIQINKIIMNNNPDLVRTLSYLKCKMIYIIMAHMLILNGVNIIIALYLRDTRKL